MSQLENIQKELERIGLHVINDEDEENPSLIVKRKPTSKRWLFQLVFTKRGRLIHLLAGKDKKAAWIDITGTGRTTKKGY